MVSRLMAGLLCGSAMISGVHAFAQEQVEEPEDERQVLETVRIVGTSVRAQASTEIEPDIRLTQEQIQAYGASTIEELLEELGPELSSGRGRGGESSVILLNGLRIPSFREIRNYPSEAVDRIDILPEEAALKFGYGANQRVVNIVLKNEFSSWTGEAEFSASTSGAGRTAEYDLGHVDLSDGRRISLDGEVETFSGILESDRGLNLFEDNGANSLSPETQSLELGGSYHRPFENGLSATFSADLSYDEDEELLGFDEQEFVLPAASPFSDSGYDTGFSRLIGVPDVLQKSSETLAANASVGLVRYFDDWYVVSNTLIGRTEATSETDREPDASAYQSALDALDPDTSPMSELAGFLTYRTEQTERITNTFSSNLLANGTLFELPAGEISTGLSLDFNHTDRFSSTRLDGILTETDLDRQIAKVQGSFDIPLISEDMDVGGIESLSLNLTASASEYSDFGALYTFDGTFSWTPHEKLRLLSSFTLEEGAPSMANLGDTVSSTPNVELFDFVNGESVLVTRISGGNADLVADLRRVMKFSANIKPLDETDLNIRLNYIDTKVDDPIGSLPGVDRELQLAFPDRFVRDTNGDLISYDTRPVNFVEETKREFQWSLFFRKSFTPPRSSTPTRSAPDSGAGGARPAGGPPSSGARPSGPPGGARRGPPGAGGGDSPDTARIFLALNHTWNLEDERLLADGLPRQDFLNGSSSGFGGTSEHVVSLNTGYFKSGYGVRLGLNWNSCTTVDGTTPDSTLSFSDLTTTDLRVFYSVQEGSNLAGSVPWLQGARFSFEIDNVFDEVTTVRTGEGDIPLRYVADRLNPEGRVARISFRKQF